MAQTADVTTLALIEPLHGLTFALFHLGCMRIIADTVRRSPLRGGGVRLIKRIEQLSCLANLKGQPTPPPEQIYCAALDLIHQRLFRDAP